MNDREMIEWLREQSAHCFRVNALGAQVWVEAIADRLEALTRPPSLSPPVSPEREAEIRKWLPVMRPRGEAVSYADDLLELYDWAARCALEAEMALCDLLQEDNRFEAGVRAGVARALESAGGTLDKYLSENAATFARAQLKAARDLAGPALRPERLAARLRKLEAALERVACMSSSDVPNWSYADVRRFAREALAEEDAT